MRANRAEEGAFGGSPDACDCPDTGGAAGTVVTTIGPSRVACACLRRTIACAAAVSCATRSDVSCASAERGTDAPGCAAPSVAASAAVLASPDCTAATRTRAAVCFLRLRADTGERTGDGAGEPAGDPAGPLLRERVACDIR